MNQDALAKLRMLKISLRCFIFGLLAFIPVLGLPFAFSAVWLSGSARQQERRFWNAARAYRIWGLVCATVAIVFWMFVGALIVYNIIVNRQIVY